MKTTTKLFFLLVVIIVIIIVMYGFTSKPAPVVETATSTVATTSAEFKVYKNEKVGFEVTYPATFTVRFVYPNAVTFATPDFKSPDNNFARINKGSLISVVRESAQNYKGYSNKQILADIAAGFSNQTAKDFDNATYMTIHGYDALEVIHNFGENHNNYRVMILLNSKQEYLAVEQQYNFNTRVAPYSKEFDSIVNSVRF